jgi:hypothetical protein
LNRLLVTPHTIYYKPLACLRCLGRLSALRPLSLSVPLKRFLIRQISLLSEARQSHVLNTSPSLRSLRLENHLSNYIMPRSRSLVSSIVRRRNWANFLLTTGILTMRAYTFYISFGVAYILFIADKHYK